MRATIINRMSTAESKAWEALSGYKFWMFGYHAAQWVNLNSLLPLADRFPSPFRDAVKLARLRTDEINSTQADLAKPLLMGTDLEM